MRSVPFALPLLPPLPLLLLLLLLQPAAPARAQAVAVAHGVPARMADAAPGSGAGAFFFATDAAYHSVDVAVDAQGGMHAVFMLYAYADGKPVYYGYCPPADPGACATAAGWTFTAVSDEMVFLQLRLTPEGRPRLLMYHDGIYDENVLPHTLYRYAECDAGCTTAAGWTVTDLVLTDDGGELYSSDYNARSFVLDAQGRPRFVYYFGGEDVGGTYELTSYYAGCDAACGDAGSWWSVRIPSYGYTDELRKAQLLFGPDGRPRMITTLDYDLATWLVYMECRADCRGPEDWTMPAPLIYIGSGPGHRFWTMALDAQGRPRVAARPLGEPIYYLWCDAADCTDPAAWLGYWVRFGEEDGGFPVLQIDRRGRPRMAYQDQEVYGLGYAWCEGACETDAPRWRYLVPETGDDLDRLFSVPIPPDCVRGAWFGGHRPSFVLDAQDNPRIGYDGEFLMECYRYPYDPFDRTTYTEAKWWTSRMLFFPDPAVATPSEPAPEVPAAAALEAAYPNPFNPATTIPYTLAQAGPVRLAVYDLLGREVAVLVDAVLPAGTHTSAWTAAGVPSGLYVVRLAAAGQTFTRTLTLLK